MRDKNMDRARALYYGMFSRLFTLSSDTKRYFELLSLIDTLKSSPLDPLSGDAFDSLAGKLSKDSNDVLVHEFDMLFYAPEHEMVPTSASFYDEGIENGRKRLEMQNFLAKTKIRRDEKLFSDYEDHVGFIFAVMSELTDLVAQGEKEYANTEHCIFNEILNEFIDDFAKNLYEHEDAAIYKDVAVILKAFTAFERIYLDVSVPVKKVEPERIEVQEEISEEERARRERNRALRAKGPKKESSCDIFVASNGEEEV